MQILIVTPAPRGSTKGNRITAQRWAAHLTELGHDVRIADANQPATSIAGDNVDCLICLHATRCSEVIRQFSAGFPGCPIVLCLTGTDLHLDLPGSRGDQAQRNARDSIRHSSRFVLLEPEGAAQLPSEARSKVRTILQSATRVEPLANQTPPATNNVFQVCVLGHLRDVKDPFLTAIASRELSESSSVRIVHVGEALNDRMKRLAQAEMQANTRYKWLGALPHEQAQRLLAESQLMVLSSKVEGAPSAISEAIVNGVPILATRIPATIGLLGSDYPGLFPVGDSNALCKLIQRAESDRKYLADLTQAIDALAPRFTPQAEKAALQRLIESIS